VDIITGANYVSFFRAQAKGIISLKILADDEDCLPGTHVVLALPHSGITTPAGLAGKTIAVNLLNDVQTMMTDETLKAGAVNTLPHYVAIPFADMPAALARHQVQAIYEDTGGPLARCLGEVLFQRPPVRTTRAPFSARGSPVIAA
jgi:NitT/TauT family transport system substrate-binding protein